MKKRAVEYILNNPVYCGRIKWKTSGNIVRNGQDNGESIDVEGEHVPLINKEMWDKAKSISDESKMVSPANFCGRCKNIPTGVGYVKCSACGANIVKSGDYWRCGRYVRGKCAVSQHISDKVLKQSIINSMKRDLSFGRRYKFPPTIIRGA